ncbi:unnamed protein product [Mesocestoides corti]|uniref:Alpha-soluble NSF attachment protein n=1 Tax=Mesocestoides corti TaxID=53468 RepID=A0A0R3UGJ4_MESCO|nr:unnamed protein product [Mesocestoides corti]
MDENEKKAREYLASAAKQPRGGFLRSLFSGHSDATEERVSLYERAANCFKMSHKWQEAGDAFVKAAELSASNKSQLDAATQYVSAAVAYRKTDPNRAITCLTRAADIYIEMGRFTIAAKHHMTMAEIYEQELANEAEACKHYERAADFYRGEESTSSARKCMLKVAHYYATSGQFEKIGVSSMDNKLLRYGTREHLMKAVVCDMNYDIVKGHSTLQKYEQNYPTFADSRECAFLKKLDEALSSEDLEKYSAAVREYDSVTRLEPWMTEMLLKLKKTLTNEEDIT